MLRQLTALLTLFALLWAPAALADPADIAAASRGVVRIVIIEQDGDELVPLSQATG